MCVCVCVCVCVYDACVCLYFSTLIINLVQFECVGVSVCNYPECVSTNMFTSVCVCVCVCFVCFIYVHTYSIVRDACFQTLYYPVYVYVYVCVCVSVCMCVLLGLIYMQRVKTVCVCFRICLLNNAGVCWTNILGVQSCGAIWLPSIISLM